MKKRLILLLVTTLFMTVLTGCRIVTPKVVYTVYPIGYILDRLAGDRIEKVSIQEDVIVQRATVVDNVDYILEDAELFLHIGNLEPYMEIYGTTIRSATPTLDLSIKSSIYNFNRYTRFVVDNVESWVETPYYVNPVMDTIDTNNRDLYVWSDPISMVSMAREIKEWLQSVFVEEFDAIEENFFRLESDLIRLDADYQNLATTLKEEDKTVKFVSMTASFGNWQRTYGFQVYPIILSKYGTLPTDAQLEVIKQRIIADGVQYIAYEPNMTEDMIVLFNQLETELNLTRVNLSNLSSINETQKNENMDYISIMYENLSTLENMASYNVGTSGTHEGDPSQDEEPSESE